MHRRLALVALLSTVVLVGLLPASAAAAEPPPLPNVMAAVGDSITQAASSGGSLGTDYPANSWSTGTNASVNSHYLRLLALNPVISGQNHNRSVSGAKMADLNGQVQQVVPLQPGYVTVLIGGNDVCTDTVDQMTSVATFRAQFTTAMNTLTSGSPSTNVYVVSVPRVTRLWELFKDDFFARFIWSVGNICQSLLANPTSTQQADVQRRAAVAQRNIDFNTQLAEVCATYLRCLFDNNAVYNTNFVASDVAGDYFHPSNAGQAKLSQGTWDVGFWAAGPPPPGRVGLGSVTGVGSPRKGGWTAAVTVTARHATGAPVSGAAVSGTWSTGASGGCTTAVSGSCTFSLNVGRKVTSVTWSVATIVHATLTYDPTLNAASSVTVPRP